MSLSIKGALIGAIYTLVVLAFFFISPPGFIPVIGLLLQFCILYTAIFGLYPIEDHHTPNKSLKVSLAYVVTSSVALFHALKHKEVASETFSTFLPKNQELLESTFSLTLLGFIIQPLFFILFLSSVVIGIIEANKSQTFANKNMALIFLNFFLYVYFICAIIFA